MATRHTNQISLNAASDLTTKQYLFARIAGDNLTDVAGAGADAIGVFFGKEPVGRPIEIGVGPRVAITLGADLVAGTEVMSDATGKAVAWIHDNRSLGYLLVGGNAGSIVEMLFTAGGRKA